jgi:hydrogenase maturation protease
MTEPIGVGVARSTRPRRPVEPGHLLPTAVVVGVGDRHRRDDGAGAAVLNLLAGRGLDATLVHSDGETSALVDILNRRDLVFLVDTVQAEPSHPGRVHRVVVTRPAYANVCAAGRHGTHVSRAIDVLQQNGGQPRRMVVFAVESADTGPGTGLSAPVAAAARRVADEIAAEIPARVAAGAGVKPGPGGQGRCQTGVRVGLRARHRRCRTNRRSL